MRLLIIFVSAFLVLTSCQKGQNKEVLKVVEETLELAYEHSMAMAESLAEQPGKLPKTIGPDGELETCDSWWWVSGFFPGQLWYMYEYSGSEEMKTWAETYTERVRDQQYTTNNHDVGFMIYCSFGNGYRLTGNEDYLSVIQNSSKSLSTRFDEVVGCIQSWDRSDWNQQWQYAVIIDNMMNLEMLEFSAKKFDEPLFSYVARTHANTTLKHHFRPDGSSYHVVSYDTITGLPELYHTDQGYSHNSAWARGQAWALYGYTMMYRETGIEAYLKHANVVADFILDHPRLPEDKIPYWDFDAPEIPNEFRDASAGAIICSALLELHQYVDDDRSFKYFKAAEKQLLALCNEPYLAEAGSNHNFVLKHSVGHWPNKSEIDVPLSYADYYFVEALLRYRKLFEEK